ncbi:MAG: hypothetical protein V6Z89_05685 [Desulfobacter sp.]
MDSKLKFKLKYLGNNFLRFSGLRKPLNTCHNFSLYDAGRRHTFYGYYDISPFNLEGTKLLSIATDNANQPIIEPGMADVGYFNIGNKSEFIKIGETTTWCWQQGCRLRWMPGHNDGLIIYNKIVSNGYGSVIQNIETGKVEQQFNCPVYDVDHSGHYGLSLNFSRLHRLRPGYGYANFKDHTQLQLCPDSEGVWRFNFISGTKELILSLEQLSMFQPEPTMENAEHYVNHLGFNPSGDRFLLFHLWVNGGKRYNRAITCDLEGKHLHLIKNKGFVSHYTWKNNQKILIFSSFKDRPGYYLYTDLTQQVFHIGADCLFKDGHPTFFEGNKKILTDTYPDKILRELSLLTYDIESGKLNTIARIFSPFSYLRECRCDLHPRINDSGDMACVDIPTSKGRRILLVDLRVLP